MMTIQNYVRAQSLQQAYELLTSNRRNRIVAGMSDAVIVVESAAKGGSLITAELAEGYHRDCFALPGRATDEYSRGCNRLIRDGAGLAADAWDREALTWAWSRGLLPETADWRGSISRSQGEALAELVEVWT